MGRAAFVRQGQARMPWEAVAIATTAVTFSASRRTAQRSAEGPPQRPQPLQVLPRPPSPPSLPDSAAQERRQRQTRMVWWRAVRATAVAVLGHARAIARAARKTQSGFRCTPTALSAACLRTWRPSWRRSLASARLCQTSLASSVTLVPASPAPPSAILMGVAGAAPTIGVDWAHPRQTEKKGLEIVAIEDPANCKHGGT